MMYTIQDDFPMCVFVSIAMGWTFVLFSTSHWDGLLPGSPINVSDTMNGVTDKTRQNKWFQTNTADAIKHSYFFWGGNSKTPIQSFPGRFCGRFGAIGLHAIWQPGSPMGRMKRILELETMVVWLAVWNILLVFPIILGIRIPTDELIFFRGVAKNYQPVVFFPWNYWRGSSICFSLNQSTDEAHHLISREKSWEILPWLFFPIHFATFLVRPLFWHRSELVLLLLPS